MDIAYRWGLAIAWYSHRVVQHPRMAVDGLDRMPDEPVIFVTWHANNLIALASHRLFRTRRFTAFVPPGVGGTTMAGWLDGVGCLETVPLPKDGSGNPSGALKRMMRAVRSDHDVVIAVDGPYGPAGRVRPGALWLARLTRAPIVPIGYAARPAVRYPRWDRHLVPLPGARVAASVGEPIRVARDEEIGDEHSTALAVSLNATDRRAEALLGAVRSADTDPSRTGTT